MLFPDTFGCANVEFVWFGVEFGVVGNGYRRA